MNRRIATKTKVIFRLGADSPTYSDNTARENRDALSDTEIGENDVFFDQGEEDPPSTHLAHGAHDTRHTSSQDDVAAIIAELKNLLDSHSTPPTP